MVIVGTDMKCSLSLWGVGWMEVRVLKPEQLGHGLGVGVGGGDGESCPINYRLVLALQLKKTTGYLCHVSHEMLGTIIFPLKYLNHEVRHPRCVL